MIIIQLGMPAHTVSSLMLDAHSCNPPVNELRFLYLNEQLTDAKKDLLIDLKKQLQNFIKELEW